MILYLIFLNSTFWRFDILAFDFIVFTILCSIQQHATFDIIKFDQLNMPFLNPPFFNLTFLNLTFMNLTFMNLTFLISKLSNLTISFWLFPERRSCRQYLPDRPLYRSSKLVQASIKTKQNLITSEKEKENQFFVSLVIINADVVVLLHRVNT